MLQKTFEGCGNVIHVTGQTADINVVSYQRFHINGIKHFVLGFAAQSQRRVRRFVPLGSKVGYRGFVQVKILDVSVAEGFLNGFDGIFSHPGREGIFVPADRRVYFQYVKRHFDIAPLNFKMSFK